jgi:hypothetical protein
VAKLIDYDVTGVEESGGGTGVKVKPGLRVARIAICEQREKKANGQPANDIRVALDFGPEYDWGFTYIGLGPESDWKLKEFIRACQLKDKGKLDPAKQVGKVIRCKVNTGEYNGEYSPDIGKLFPAQPGDEVGSASEVSQQAGPDADEGEPDAEADASGEKTYDNPDFVPFREGLPDPTNEDETVGSYDDWPDADLEAEVADRGLTLPGGRGSKKQKMIDALRAEDQEVLGDESEAQEQSETAVAEAAAEGGDDYDDWDVDRLKQEAEERQLDVPAIRGSNAEARLKAKLIELLRADDGGDAFTA